MPTTRELVIMGGGIAGILAALLAMSGLHSEATSQLLVAVGALIALSLARAS